MFHQTWDATAGAGSQDLPVSGMFTAWRSDVVQMARDLGVRAERPPWALLGNAARGPYRGLEAMLRVRYGTRHGKRYSQLIVSIRHARPLHLGLHAAPRLRPVRCDGCDVFAAPKPLGTPEIIGYADDEGRAKTLLSSPRVRAAFAALEGSEPVGRFGVHVNDSVVWVVLHPKEQPTPGLLEAMHALSWELVSSTPLPDAPPAPPLRRRVVARVLFILLAPPVFFVTVMALGLGIGQWAAFGLVALAFGLVVCAPAGPSGRPGTGHGGRSEPQFRKGAIEAGMLDHAVTCFRLT